MLGYNLFSHKVCGFADLNLILMYLVQNQYLAVFSGLVWFFWVLKNI